MTTSINQSLAHGLEILLLYNASTPLLTVSEISKQLRYSQSKTYRLVRTLIKYGFLQENNGTAQYSLSLTVLRLGLVAQEQFKIAVIARSFMKELSQITKETVLLTSVNGTKGLFLKEWKAKADPVSHYSNQELVFLHGGASSKCLDGLPPEEEWDRIISREGLETLYSEYDYRILSD
jgi:DNA-binding IclR family transcriptional regulator